MVLAKVKGIAFYFTTFAHFKMQKNVPAPYTNG